VKLIFVNGKAASLDTVLHNGDQVGVGPAVGGM
jgi:molybdopterin converting factor small subunit